jgi:hypothetical protein
VREPRPWWASDLDGDVAAPADVDPLEAHRAARRGASPSDAEGWWDLDELLAGPATEDATAGATEDDADHATDAGADGRPSGGTGPKGAHGPDVCGVCPICLALRSLGESRPQLLEHLTEAARHLAAAVRSVVEEPPRSRSEGVRHEPGDDPFERIDLD